VQAASGRNRPAVRRFSSGPAGRVPEQAAAEGELSGAATVGEIAIMADAVERWKPPGQV
jgi:hypothetical protein